MEVLGVDIGGSAIKGTIVNTLTGEFTTERFRIPTSQPATIGETVDTISKLVNHFGWKGKIGFGFPAVVQHGVIKTASNIDKGFIEVDAVKLFADATGCEVSVYNDADVAGFAELKFGTVRNFNGLAIFLTIGTGIGSAIFNEGKLIPNTELGHIFMKNGKKGEHFASDAVRKREELDWTTWGKRFNKYINYLESLFYPELIILGGGTSKKFEKFQNQLKTSCRVEPASLLNNAGIVGAALLA